MYYPTFPVGPHLLPDEEDGGVAGREDEEGGPLGGAALGGALGGGAARRARPLPGRPGEDSYQHQRPVQGHRRGAGNGRHLALRETS